MPLYDFECEDCGPFSVLRTIDHRNLPALCPHCERTAARVISAPNLALMSPGIRKAHATNERSCHEPKVRKAHQCGSGCGCGSKSIDVVNTAKNRTAGFGKFQSGRKSNRPWMLGH